MSDTDSRIRPHRRSGSSGRLSDTQPTWKSEIEKKNEEPKLIKYSRKSDLTLISSDDVRFQVSFAMMSEASSVFDEMFSLPQPSKPPTPTSPTTRTFSDVPEIQLEESSASLKLLLSWIYPVNDPPRLKTLQETGRLLLIARKYDITVQLLRSLFILLNRPLSRMPNPVRNTARTSSRLSPAVSGKQNTTKM